MFKLRQNIRRSDKNRFRWSLGTKIGGLATVLLLLMGGVSSYFYFEIAEISREIEEIGNSDFPLYNTTTQLILCQKEKLILLEELSYVNRNAKGDRELYLSEIARKFTLIESKIDKILLEGIQKSRFALLEEERKENKNRLNQEIEDYQKLQEIFIQLDSENSKFVLTVGQLLRESQNNSLEEDSIVSARQQLIAFNELASKIIDRLEDHINGSVSATVKERTLAIKTNALIASSAVLFGISISSLITRQITNSVNKVTQQAKFIANNVDRKDLNSKVLTVDTSDEIRDLSVAFNLMVENFLCSQLEKEKIEQEILSEKEFAQWQASHDSLTGLINRRDFERQLSQIWQNEHLGTHSLIYIDLDRFKIVNDTCGHSAGDKLLQQVSKIFQTQISPSDTLARLGGDEFAVIIYECSQHEALKTAQKILDSIQRFCFLWNNQSFTVGVSIGVLSFEFDRDTVSSVLKAADAACYNAKNRGRNQIYVMENKELELAQQSQQMNWLSLIGEALESNGFVLYYQTIKPLQNNSRNSNHYEVLLRMKGQNGEVIPPMAFIPIAERYQLMNQIDRWVIHNLLATQAARYRQQDKYYGFKGCYAINISGQTLDDLDFVNFVREQLNRYQIPPEEICFEITETVAISNLAQAKQIITQLRALGCRFALDDFGNGMSSFAYLKSLPVDFLKIDGMFIRELLNEPINGTIVQSFHQVAQEMGIATIAEFVDSEQKLEKLRSLGINYAQGYWIDRPQPLSNLQLLDNQKDFCLKLT